MNMAKILIAQHQTLFINCAEVKVFNMCLNTLTSPPPPLLPLSFCLFFLFLYYILPRLIFVLIEKNYSEHTIQKLFSILLEHKQAAERTVCLYGVLGNYHFLKISLSI